ncbi:MAG TPA: S1/P1 nuclease [Verrucomicrobiae bacterium]|nr:S1/P1 nuclease [Verrucomicrobiae bacterium]
MNRHRCSTRFSLLICVVLCVNALSARAWGPQGHEIVGRIAELHLTPQTLQAVNELLNGTNTAVTIHISEDGVANWADHVRRDRPESGPWHYVDIPFAALGFDRARDCLNHTGCVVEAIEHFQRVLKNPDASAEKRVEALRYLVHFVGDIHQPLHCAERKGDKGGNLCLVLWPGISKPVKLHVVWDVYLIEKSLSDRKLDTLAYADYLNQALAIPNAESWSTGKPPDWAWESHHAAVTVVYDTIPAEGQPELLSAEYILRGQGLVDFQLSKAGLRLAALLNHTLGPQN